MLKNETNASMLESITRANEAIALYNESTVLKNASMKSKIDLFLLIGGKRLIIGVKNEPVSDSSGNSCLKMEQQPAEIHQNTPALLMWRC